MAINAINLTGGIQGEPIVFEKLAAASPAVVPGMLVSVNSSELVIPHPTAAASAQKLFALENLVNAADIDTAYNASSTVRVGAFQTGQIVYAIVAAAAGAIVIGDLLESAGDGTLRKAATDAATDTQQRNAIVGYAVTAVDNSAGVVAARIKVRVA